MENIQPITITSLQNDIQVIYVNSINAVSLLTGHQSAIKRYVFAATQKIAKTSIGIKQLISVLKHQEEVEFPIGILLRSLLMDSILTFSLTQTMFGTTKENYYDKQRQLLDQCTKLLSDGTLNIINEIRANPDIDEAEKQRLMALFASKFDGAIEQRGERYRLNPDFKIQISGVFSSLTHEDLVMKDHAFGLYTFYSKYDHLSHWTPAAQSLPYEGRLVKIKTSFLLIISHLQQLFALAKTFETTCGDLNPMLDKLREYMKSQIPLSEA